MALIVEVQVADDTFSQAIYDDIRDSIENLEITEIEIVEKKTDNFSPDVAQGLVIGIASGMIGGLATHYFIKFIDYILDRVKKRDLYSMVIIVKHQDEVFVLPKDIRSCRSYFEGISKD